MSRQIRLAIVGFGGFGKFIFKALEKSDLYSITCIADEFISEDSLPKNIPFESDWKKVADHEDVDAVLIATPPSSHAEMSLFFLQAGKHVMAEKPVATSYEDAIKLADTAQENGLVLMVDFMQRFNPILEVLHNLHKQGRFGKFERYFVENYAQDQTLTPDHWFWKPEISGGILIEHAVHFIDIVHWFAGDIAIKKIDGYTDSRSSSQMDRMALNVHYENGLLATHTHSFCRPTVFERTNMRLVFSQAQFDIKGWIPEEGTFTALVSEENLEALSALTQFTVTHKEPLSGIPVRGKQLEYEYLVEGSFKAAISKSELYAFALKQNFKDFAKSILSSDHETRVSLSDAVKAVYVAEEATNNATNTFQP